MSEQYKNKQSNYNKMPKPQPYYEEEKVLEQEDVFNKIKAEVEKLPITDTAVRLVTEILDKHKAESEDKE